MESVLIVDRSHKYIVYHFPKVIFFLYYHMCIHLYFVQQGDTGIYQYLNMVSNNHFQFSHRRY